MPAIATSALLAGSIIDEQIKLEEKATADGVARYRRLAREAETRGEAAALKPAERLIVHWFHALSTSIRKDIASLRRGHASQGATAVYPAFSLSDPDQLALIALHEVIGATIREPDGVIVSALSTSIGRAVIAEINLKLLKSHDGETRDRRRSRIAAGEDRKAVYKEEEEALKRLDVRFRNVTPGRMNWWAKRTLAEPRDERAAYSHIGGRLIWHVIDACLLTDEGETFPAFTRKRIGSGTNRPAAVVPDWRTLRIIDEGHEARETLRPRYLPMLVPPYPWLTDEQGRPVGEGGYAKIRTPFVSKPSKEQKRALDTANLETVCTAMSAIGNTGWRINRRIREIQQAVYQQGGGWCRVPRRENVPYPEKPAGYNAAAKPKDRWADVPEAEKRAYKAAASAAIRENTARTAEREDFLSKQRVANLFLHREQFYNPHQLCFRSRAYPVPVPLNHQNDDVCRGLLEFAEAKPIDEEGMYWLKAHAAAMYGIDDVSYGERVRWADEHMAQILASAADPMECDFWTRADEGAPGDTDGNPWQFLAACFAIADPEEAGARLPVQSDATANGLQHYTALGRDEIAAPTVNLTAVDAPNSVYLTVADHTEQLVTQDARAGVRLASKILEACGGIDKPIAKPPTMTSCYGVTEIGARKQVEKALRKKGYADDDLFEASRYLVERVNKGIERSCTRAIAIMAWLRTCARLQAVRGHLVGWTSPIGFPVVQSYRNFRTFRVETILQDIYLINEDSEASVSVDEQVNGVSPNFVHAIDAAHMMLTAIECEKLGITFAGVHDSYWTHAATRMRLARVTRETFIRIHRRDLLTELVEEWRAKYPDIEFPDPPERGTFDINEVADAGYMFN